LIVLATLALGLLLHFVWWMRFLARSEALWLAALLIVVSIPIVIGAAWQLNKRKTAFADTTSELPGSGMNFIDFSRK
jgi:hypothetical protein